PMFNRYAIERMRSYLRIVEPDVHPDPYRQWSRRIGDVTGDLPSVTESLPSREIVERIEGLLRTITELAAKRGHNYSQARVEVLLHGLRLAPVVGAEFASALLQQVPPAHAAFRAKNPQPRDDYGTSLLRETVNIATFFDQESPFPYVAEHLAKYIQERALTAVSILAGPCLRFLRKYNRR